MARLINPTPKLDAKATKIFLDLIEQGLKNPVGLVPTPKINKVRKIILSDAIKRRKHNASKCK